MKTLAERTAALYATWKPAPLGAHDYTREEIGPYWDAMVAHYGIEEMEALYLRKAHDEANRTVKESIRPWFDPAFHEAWIATTPAAAMTDTD